MTDNQIKNGIPKIIENAVSLFSDATLLEENQRIERAYTLYQLSIEEIGKAFMLIGSLIFENVNDSGIQKKLKEDIKNHQAKSKKSIGLDVFLQEFMRAKDVEKYEKLVLKSFDEFENTNSINEKKNSSLYVSFNGNKFLKPSECVTIQDLTKIKARASYRIFIGEKLFPAIIDKAELFKEKMIEFEFDKLKVSKEQQDEFKRIREKYK